MNTTHLFQNNTWYMEGQRRVYTALRKKWPLVPYADIQDAFQDAAIGAHKYAAGGGRFTDKEGLFRWLVRVADRGLNTLHRRSKRNEHLSLDADQRLGTGLTEPDGTEQEAHERNLQILEEALSQVTPLQKDLLNERYRDELSIQEIQVLHGYSTENSAKQAAHKAREAVRRFIFRRAA